MKALSCKVKTAITTIVCFFFNFENVFRQHVRSKLVELTQLFIIFHIKRDHGWNGVESVSKTKKEQISFLLKLLVTNTFHGLITSSSLLNDLLTCINTFKHLITVKTTHPWSYLVQTTNPPTPLVWIFFFYFFYFLFSIWTCEKLKRNINIPCFW